MKPDCEHGKTRIDVRITRLTNGDNGPVTGWAADIGLTCSDCGAQFKFLGLPAGIHPTQPRVSLDGTELRIPIEPGTPPQYN